MLHPPSEFTKSDQSQAQQGLLSPLIIPSPFPWLWFRQIVDRDSGNLVNPFMRVTNQMTRHLATLRESQLLPPFTRALLNFSTLTFRALGRNHIEFTPFSGPLNALFFNQTVGFPLSAPVLSWLFFVLEGRIKAKTQTEIQISTYDTKPLLKTRPQLPETGPPQSLGSIRRFPPKSAVVPSQAIASELKVQTLNPQSHSFSRSYGTILPTSLAYIVLSTRGFKPWRPDADMSTTRGANKSLRRIFKDRSKGTGYCRIAVLSQPINHISE